MERFYNDQEVEKDFKRCSMANPDAQVKNILASIPKGPVKSMVQFDSLKKYLEPFYHHVCVFCGNGRDRTYMNSSKVTRHLQNPCSRAMRSVDGRSIAKYSSYFNGKRLQRFLNLPAIKDVLFEIEKNNLNHLNTICDDRIFKIFLTTTIPFFLAEVKPLNFSFATTSNPRKRVERSERLSIHAFIEE